MKTVRIICLVLALALCVSLLSACSLFGNASLSSDVGSDGRFVYSIIRGAESSDTVGNAAKSIRSAIVDNFGCKANFAKDDVIEEVKNACEILVGDTNRAASAEAKKIVMENRTNNALDFIVKVIDNQVCIQAANDDMIAVACEWFVATFCQSKETWEQLTHNYEFLYQSDNETLEPTIAGTNVGMFTIVKPLEMSYVIGLQVDEFIKLFTDYGLKINYIDDIDPEETYEILIGNTSREESKSVKVEGDNYIIKVVGTKLVIKGGNDLACWRGVKDFYDRVKNSSAGEPINWTDGYVINGKYDANEKGAYTLNFEDEFEGSTLDFSVWGDYNYQSGRTAKSCLGGTNWYADVTNKSSAYKAALPHKSVYVADGNLVLATYKLNDTDFVGTYASTFKSMLFKYGVLEIRGKQSLSPGCMSYWTNGAGTQNLNKGYGDLTRACMTEVDIIETFGSQTYFAANVHRWGNDGVHNSMDGVAKYKVKGNNKSYTIDTERFGGDLTENFHTYTLYWDDECMKFAFDGRVFVTYDYKQEMSVSVHCLLNYINLHFRMGDASYGRTWKADEHPDYVESYIDSIRIYQTDSILSQMVEGPGEFETGGNGEVTIRYPEHPITGEY